jgi:hypothetical protein
MKTSHSDSFVASGMSKYEPTHAKRAAQQIAKSTEPKSLEEGTGRQQCSEENNGP